MGDTALVAAGRVSGIPTAIANYDSDLAAMWREASVAFFVSWSPTDREPSRVRGTTENDAPKEASGSVKAAKHR
jgi:hypothetical protein